MDSCTDDFGGEGRSISELPDDVLIHILSFLTATDIEATSDLSTRWKSLSELFPIRNFETLRIWAGEPPAVQKNIHSLDSFQREVQLLPDKARIGKFDLIFRLQICSDEAENESNSKLMSLLNDVILKHKVEKFEFWYDLIDSESINKPVPLPDSLFTSESLTSLMLTGAQTSQICFPTSIVLFPSLKTLHLNNADIENAKQLFLGHPVLEELELEYCRWNYDKALSISIAPLQRLTISHSSIKTLLLRIKSSNLRSLNLTTCSRFEFEFERCNLSSLAEVHLKIIPMISLLPKPRHDLAHKTLEFLERIRHVKHLELAAHTLQTISCATKLDVPAFSNLTHLKVSEDPYYGLSGATPLMHILQNSPNLHSLDCPKGFDVTILPVEDKLFKKNVVPNCLKHSLKTFSMSNFGGKEVEVRFLKYILENADALKHFSVTCKPYKFSHALKISIEQDLRRLCRENCLYLFDKAILSHKIK